MTFNTTRAQFAVCFAARLMAVPASLISQPTPQRAAGPNPRNRVMRLMKTTLAAMVCFTSVAAAQITALCNTGQTRATAAGCTGVLVTPNPTGGGPDVDGNWQIAYPYPSSVSSSTHPCSLSYEKAWVDTPPSTWMPESASTASEWITPYDGEGNQLSGRYVYGTAFPIPAKLPGGSAPVGFTINGRLASDNATSFVFVGNVDSCTLVATLPEPVNPAGSGLGDFQDWWDFSFINPAPITPSTEAYLFFVVENAYDDTTAGPSPTGLRVEFLSTSALN